MNDHNICDECGIENPPGEDICSNCGAKLVKKTSLNQIKSKGTLQTHSAPPMAPPAPPMAPPLKKPTPPVPPVSK